MKKDYIFIVIAIFLLFITTNMTILNIIIYSMAIVPLAIMLGEGTSIISEEIGQKKGGLIAATIGNIPEAMMGMWSIKYGMIPMLKASLIGAIISNMLLVLGISIFFGGIKYREQRFNKQVARTNFNMLLLVMAAMVVMASLNEYGTLEEIKLISISTKMSIVLILIYVLGLIFSLYTHSNLFVVTDSQDEIKGEPIKVKKVFIKIILTSVILFFISEKLIVNIQEMVKTYNISQEFIGIILIPILGNCGENFSAILCSIKNKVNLSLEIAIGSSIQIALFVTPLLIIIAYFMGVNMTFLFTNFQIIISAIAIFMSFIVFQDGKTYWFEGSILMAIYIMITVAYYYVA